MEEEEEEEEYDDVDEAEVVALTHLVARRCSSIIDIHTTNTTYPNLALFDISALRCTILI